MKRLILMLSVACAAPAIAEPPTLSVQNLYQECQRDSIQCTAYIAGVFDLLVVQSGSPKPNSGYMICIDPDVTYGAAQQAFMNWASRHPEHWGKTQLVGVVLALEETWRCGK